MINFIRNFKIKTIVIMLIALAVLSIAITDFLGLSGMTTIDNNMSNMYKDNLIGISRLGAARSDFITIRLNAEKATLQYDSKYEQEIKVYHEKLETRIKQFETTNLDEFEGNKIKEIKNTINEYMDTWGKVKLKILNTGKIPEEDISLLTTLGEKTENTIVELRDYNEKHAEKINSDSNKIYLSKVKELFYTAIAIMLVLSLIGYSIVKLITNSIIETVDNLEIVASGDLTVAIRSDEENEFGVMKKALYKTVENIKEMVRVIKSQSAEIDNKAESLSAISEEMSSASQNITTAIQDIAQGTSTQSDEIVNTNIILNKFNEQLEETIRLIAKMSSSASNIENLAEDSNIKMNELVDSVKNVHTEFNDFTVKISTLGLNINKINEILNLINGIADETNLLSLNASIEAARAGDAGKGFSVVADKIRKLSEQSKFSSKSINSIIGQISNDTNIMISTSDVLKKELSKQLSTLEIAIMSFDNIIKSIKTVTPQINNANLSMNSVKEQRNIIVEKLESTSAISEEVSASAEEISASTEEMNASSEEVANTALELSNMTKEIVYSLAKFKL
jgi:Methyl-accepting chemotaxis protein